jgi:hypothetical protein
MEPITLRAFPRHGIFNLNLSRMGRIGLVISSLELHITRSFREAGGRAVLTIRITGGNQRPRGLLFLKGVFVSATNREHTIHGDLKSIILVQELEATHRNVNIDADHDPSRDELLDGYNTTLTVFSDNLTHAAEAQQRGHGSRIAKSFLVRLFDSHSAPEVSVLELKGFNTTHRNVHSIDAHRWELRRALKLDLAVLGEELVLPVRLPAQLDDTAIDSHSDSLMTRVMMGITSPLRHTSTRQGTSVIANSLFLL